MVAPIPRDSLLEDLQRVASEVNEPPSGSQYAEHGEYSTSALRREFGGIPDARTAAGLDGTDQRGGHNQISRDELLTAIHDLHDELGRTPRREEMLDMGDYSENPFRREFGSWGDAVTEAGYDPYRPNGDLAKRIVVTCAQCETEKKVLASQNNEQERWFCSRDCHGKWKAEHRIGENHHQYNRKTVSCESCGEEMDRISSAVENKSHYFCDYECYADWCSDERTGDDHPRFKGGGELYYGPNWQRQRRKRREYDGYECQRCGMTDEKSRNEFGRELEVHHLKSVRDFHNGQKAIDWQKVNSIDNLVTLCLPCHRRIEKLSVVPQFD